MSGNLRDDPAYQPYQAVCAAEKAVTGTLTSAEIQILSNRLEPLGPVSMGADSGGTVHLFLAPIGEQKATSVLRLTQGAARLIARDLLDRVEPETAEQPKDFQ